MLFSRDNTHTIARETLQISRAVGLGLIGQWGQSGAMVGLQMMIMAAIGPSHQLPPI